MQKKDYDAVIVGAGIAGLVLAYKLTKSGKEVLLIEKSNQVGGSWKSYTYKDSIYEMGPNSLMNRCEELNEIIADLEFEDQLISKSFKDSKRYLYLRDKFYTVESSPLKMILSPILSLGTKLKIFLEPFAKKTDAKEESIFDFISRRFNTELAELVSAALQGIWAGDSKKLSAKAALKSLVKMEEEHGSILLAGLKKAFSSSSRSPKTKLSGISFQDGMQALAKRIAEAIGVDNILLNTELKTFGFKEGFYALDLTETTARTKKLVLSGQAYASAQILASFDKRLSVLLEQIYYAPVFLTVFVIKKSCFTKLSEDFFDAFGFISKKEDYLTLGTLFSSQLFSERKLKDEYVFLNIAGGAINPQISSLSDEKIEELIVKEHQEYFAQEDLSVSDFEILDSRMIKQAIPQYQFGHDDLLASINDILLEYPGLHLAGNYLKGVSITDTVKLSVELSHDL